MASVTFGYVRVSTKDQNEERQIARLKELGVDDRHIYVDKTTGKDFNDRPAYDALLLTLREGDLLYIDSLDRLGRSYDSNLKEWKRITREIGADVVALDMESVFDSRKFRAQGDVGKLMEDQMTSILSWVAEQERKKMLERQRPGIERAKREGKYKGRKPVEYDKYEFERLYREVLAGERTNKYAMDKLGLKRNTYYKAVEQYKTKTGIWAEK